MTDSPSPDFSRAENTIILSDVHLADAEPPHPKSPLWKRFKRPRYFVDRKIRDMLEHMQKQISGEIELIFNGDIFDFDSVMVLPPKSAGMHLSWLERNRGINSEEAKSRFKMKVILQDHSVWVDAIRDFVLKGNRVVFVIGNHDMELHWPSVRQDFLDHLRLPEEARERIRFCEWYYISNGDTLIEHGNQYDAYSLCSNPVNPLIKKAGKVYVRIPFGNLAGKFMLNGMGLMNPHAEASFIKDSIKEYVVFYYKYVLRTQPFLLFTWFWSAMVTMVYSVAEGLLPAMTDPLTIHDRVRDIARRSNSDVSAVWALRELHVHPAVYNPFKILRELWLDRAIILALIVFLSFQFFSTLNVFVQVSFWWFVVPLILLLPLLLFYARSVESEVLSSQAQAFKAVPVAARIARVRRVVQGHTHLEKHTFLEGIEYLNTGTWSAAFKDVECTQPYGRKCFAWIRSKVTGERVAELFEWTEQGPVLVPVQK